MKRRGAGSNCSPNTALLFNFVKTVVELGHWISSTRSKLTVNTEGRWNVGSYCIGGFIGCLIEMGTGEDYTGYFIQW